jgi:hypothetical protein
MAVTSSMVAEKQVSSKRYQQESASIGARRNREIALAFAIVIPMLFVLAYVEGWPLTKWVLVKGAVQWIL